MRILRSEGDTPGPSYVGFQDMPSKGFFIAREGPIRKVFSVFSSSVATLVRFMQIRSTHIERRAIERPKSFDRAQPSLAPEYSNTSPDSVSWQNSKKTLAGALVGAAVVGGLAQVSLGGAWGAAGAAIGGLAGGLICHNSDQLVYDGKSVVNYLKARHRSDKLAAEYEEKKDVLSPLGGEFRIANDPVGDIRRAFDGYDSSRNLTGLLAQEGAAEEPFRVAAELAHLRPSAEKQALQTRFVLGSEKNALRVEVGAQGAQGPQGLSEGLKGEHSARFNLVILEVDKELLRQRGWKDGESLPIKVETREAADKEAFDSVEGSSGRRVPERMFRWEGKTIYQIMTDRFANGDTSNDQGADPGHSDRFHGGDWQGVLQRMDYLKELGVDCIWLSCPYENDTDFFGTDGYHGYWPHDFRSVEKRFGSKEKLKELVDRAHDNGMKVMLDVVVNHTGYNHPAVKDPQFRDWFHRDGARNPLSQFGLENGSLAGLPDLKQENPEVSHYLIDVHTKWIEDSDVDGFRVDAIRHVPEKFLQEFDTALKAKKEGFVTIGEVFWNDPYYLAGYQNGTQDSLFDFPLMEAMRDVFGGNPDMTLKERWTQFQETKQHNFGQAIMDLTKQGGQSMEKLSKVLAKDHAYDNPRLLSTILDNHDTGRFLSHAGGDRDKLKLAAAFLYGVRGTPSIYYGTESGMEGQMGENRQDMRFDTDPELKAHFRKLIAMRKESPALNLGTQQELLVTGETYAFTRVLPGEEVVCCYNNGEEETTVALPLSETQMRDGDLLRRLDADGSVRVVDGVVELTLPAKGYAFYRWTR